MLTFSVILKIKKLRFYCGDDNNSLVVGVIIMVKVKNNIIKDSFYKFYEPMLAISIEIKESRFLKFLKILYHIKLFNLHCDFSIK